LKEKKHSMFLPEMEGRRFVGREFRFRSFKENGPGKCFLTDEFWTVTEQKQKGGWVTITNNRGRTYGQTGIEEPVLLRTYEWATPKQTTGRLVHYENTGNPAINGTTRLRLYGGLYNTAGEGSLADE